MPAIRRRKGKNPEGAIVSDGTPNVKKVARSLAFREEADLDDRRRATTNSVESCSP